MRSLATLWPRPPFKLTVRLCMTSSMRRASHQPELPKRTSQFIMRPSLEGRIKSCTMSVCLASVRLSCTCIIFTILRQVSYLQIWCCEVLSTHRTLNDTWSQRQNAARWWQPSGQGQGLSIICQQDSTRWKTCNCSVFIVHTFWTVVYRELLHIANEMYDVCSVHSARQFAGRHI